MQQAARSNTEIVAFVATLGDKDEMHTLAGVVDPILEAEIRQFIRKCHRGRATGPDELGNDWYRDNVDQLVPLLTEIFNRWLQGDAVPRSFGQAHIHCLKKSTTAATPLEHRPIALLNTEYKINARIFATRLRPGLPE